MNLNAIKIFDVDDPPLEIGYGTDDYMTRHYRHNGEDIFQAISHRQQNEIDAKYFDTPAEKKIAAFNGTCDPHITEADCRQSKDAWPFPKALDVETSKSVSEVVNILRSVAEEMGIAGETEAEQPEDGWIPWHGGDAPPCDDVVAVRLRSGCTYAEPLPSFWNYERTHRNPAFDIVAYRRESEWIALPGGVPAPVGAKRLKCRTGIEIGHDPKASYAKPYWRWIWTGGCLDIVAYSLR